jgi:hypothetical protein
MGRRVTGIEGSVTSWGSSGQDGYHLITTALSHNQVSLAIEADDIDVTGDADTSKRSRTGLRAWSGTIRGTTTRAARAIGNAGLVTFASGYATHVNEWAASFEANELDITDFDAADTTWRYWMPGKLVRVSGSYRGFIDAATGTALPVSPSASGTGSASATFGLTAANTFAGNIVTNKLDVDIPIGADGVQTYAYEWQADGDITVASGVSSPGNNILPTGTFDQFTWDADADGVADLSMVVTSSSGRTYTGAAFLTGLSVTVPVGGLIEVSATFRGSGPLTVA